MTFTTLMLGVIWGSIGIGYWIYGKRQGSFTAMLCGIALGVFPYFVENVWLGLLIGLGLSALPWFFRE